MMRWTGRPPEPLSRFCKESSDCLPSLRGHRGGYCLLRRPHPSLAAQTCGEHHEHIRVPLVRQAALCAPGNTKCCTLRLGKVKHVEMIFRRVGIPREIRSVSKYRSRRTTSSPRLRKSSAGWVVRVLRPSELVPPSGWQGTNRGATRLREPESVQFLGRNRLTGLG